MSSAYKSAFWLSETPVRPGISGVAFGAFEVAATWSLDELSLFREDTSVTSWSLNDAETTSAFTARSYDIPFHTISSPRRVAMGDMNGDGVSDAVLLFTGDQLRWFAGGYSAPTWVHVPGPSLVPPPQSFDFTANWLRYLADVDDDGITDLLVYCQYCIDNSPLTWFRGLGGNGTMETTARELFSPVGNANRFAFHDVDNDGDTDVLFLEGGLIKLRVALASAVMSGSSVTVGADTNIRAFAVADFNGDNLADVAYLVTSTAARWIENTGSTGSPAFTTIRTIRSMLTGLEIIAVDYDQDGVPDVVATNSDSNSITVDINTGTGTTWSSVTCSLGGYAPFQVADGDVNGDGFPDLVMTLGSGRVGYVVNTGSGTGCTESQQLVLESAYHVVLADATADDRLDLITSGSNGHMRMFENVGASGTAPAFDDHPDLVFTPSGNPQRPPFAPASSAADAITIFAYSGSEYSSYSRVGMVGSRTGYTLGREFRNTSLVVNLGYTADGVITVEDLDNDGDLDLIVKEWSGAAILVFKNTWTDSGYAPGAALSAVFETTPVTACLVSASATLTGLATGDIRGTGRTDMLIALANSEVWVALHEPTPLAFVVQLVSAELPGSIVKLVDMNQDGFLDAIVTNGQGVAWYPWSSSLVAFQTDDAYTWDVAAPDLGYVLVGDVNNDTFVDVVIAESGGRPGLLLNAGMPGGRTWMGIRWATGVTVDNDVHLMYLADAALNGFLDIVYEDNRYVRYLANQGRPDYWDYMRLMTDEYGSEAAYGLANLDMDGDSFMGAAASIEDAQMIITRNPDGTGLDYTVTSRFSPLYGAVFSLAAADLNMDGWPDLVATGAEQVYVQWNLGQSPWLDDGGSASTLSALMALGEPKKVATCDVDDDGLLDVVVLGTTHLGWLGMANASTATFAGSASVIAPLASTCGAPSRLTIADVDDDGWPDMVLVCEAAPNRGVVWFRHPGAGVGAGAWGTARVLVSRSQMSAVAFGDLDGDGRTDAMVCGSNGTDVPLSWMRGVGNGTFGVPWELPMADQGCANLELRDWSRDGWLDVIAYPGVGDWRLVTQLNRMRTRMPVPGGYSGFDDTTQNVFSVSPVSRAVEARSTDYNHDGWVDLSVTSPSGWGWALGPNAWTLPTKIPRQLRVDVVRCGFTLACINNAISRAGRCQDDTIVVPAGTYRGCMHKQPYLVQKNVHVRAEGSVTVLCEGGGIGGGRYVWQVGVASSLSVTGITFEGAVVTTTDLGGGVFRVGGGTAAADASSLTLRDVTVRGARVVDASELPSVSTPQFGYAGAVLVESWATVRMDGCRFVDNRVHAGGAIMVAGEAIDFEARGVIFEANDATSSGGAVLVETSVLGASSSMVFSGCAFVGNRAGTKGGGVHAILANALSVLHVVDTTVAENLADSHGGGVAVAGAGWLRLDNTTVHGNTALHGGGVSVGAGARVNVTRARVTENHAVEGAGGGLLVREASAFLGVSASRVSGNQGRWGAGIAVDTAAHAAEVSVSGSTLDGNTAEIAGGAIALLGASDVTVRLEAETTVSSNHAGMGGVVATAVPQLAPLPTSAVSLALPLIPASYTSASVVRADASCGFVDNHATYGALALVCGARVHLEGGSSSNSASVAGGGMFACVTADQAIPGQAAASVVPTEGVRADGYGDVRGTMPVVMTAIGQPETSASGVLLGSGSVDIRDAYDHEITFDPSIVVTVRSAGAASVAGVGEWRLTKHEAPSLALTGLAMAGWPETLPAAVPLVLEFLGHEAWVPRTETIEVTACPAGWGRTSGDNGEEPLVCGQCPDGTFSGNTSSAACESAVGCGGDAVVVNGECVGCPANTQRVAVSNVTGGAPPCVCERGFFSPSGEVDVACEVCPRGGSCAGGQEAPVSAPGFYEDASGVFVACPNSEACAGSGMCATGYTGRLCGECADGYYELNGRCHACKNARTVVLMLLLVIVVVVVVGVLLWFNLAESVSYKFVAAMIGLNALQITAIYGKLDLDFGPVPEAIFDVLSSLNLNIQIASPECSLDKGVDAWVLKWVLTMLLPVFAAVTVALVGAIVFVVGRVLLGGKWTVGQMVDGVKRTWYQCMVLLYLPLVAGALSVFGCRKDAAGKWVLVAQPSRACYDSAWWGLFVPALMFVVAYAVAFPLAVMWVVWKAREEDLMVASLRYGFLIARFKPKWWHFEASGVMARKLGVVMCMTFFFTDQGKANAAVLLLAGSMAQLFGQSPFQRTRHNRLAMVVLAATTCVLYAGTFADYALRRVGVLFGLVVNLGAILAGNAWDMWQLTQEEKAAEDDDFWAPGVVRSSRPDSVAGMEATSMQMTSLGLTEQSGDALATMQMATLEEGGVQTLQLSQDNITSGADMSLNSVSPSTAAPLPRRPSRRPPQ